jgi:hypothetical protein
MLTKNKNLVVNVCRVFYALCSEVAFKDGTDRFHKTIRFPQGLGWKEIYYTTGTAEYSEGSKINDPGNTYVQLLNVVFPGIGQTNTKSIDDLFSPLVLLMKLSTGEYMIFGSPSIPSRLNVSLAAGAKNSNFQLQFSCTSQEPAWWSDLPVTGLPE